MPGRASPRRPARAAIYGIPCRLRSLELRRVVRRVLDQIRKRCPRDFERLRRLVREIAPLPRGEMDNGDVGWWRQDTPAGSPLEDWGPDELDGAFPGVLLLSEEPHGQDLFGVVAHEFGHTCTTDEDERRRGSVPFDEWAVELSADWYAYKWGFGRAIARTRKTRDSSHHGPAPGSTFTIGEGQGAQRFRVTRNLCVRAT